MSNEIEIFWNLFLDKNKLPSSVSYFEAFSFGDSKEMADELAQLVMIGKKRATASSKMVYQLTKEREPQIGDYSIVLDSNQKPVCVIKTTHITTLPFSEIPFDLCKREGEDDSLESWQRSHRAFWMREAETYKYKFTEDMLILFEEFIVKE